MLWADCTDVSGWAEVFCLNVVFDICSTRLESALQTLPLTPSEACQQFINISCKSCICQSLFIQHSISMSSGHVIIQSHPIFDMLRADFTFITRGSSVFGLDVVFNNCSAGLVSTGQAFPLAPTKTCHQFLRIHCKMKKTRQLRQNVFSMSQYNWDFLWALARWFLRAILFLSISGHLGQ